MKLKVRDRLIMILISMSVIFIPQIAKAGSFKDVLSNKWYYKEIESVRKLGIINGYDDNTYKPDNTLTKVEALKIIAESKEQGDIKEVKGKWYSKYIYYGESKGIIVKDIDKPITRKEVSEYIVKIFEKETEPSKGILQDSNDVNIEKLYKDGIIKGYESSGKPLIKPNGKLTRAEMAALINRVLEVENAKNGILEDDTSYEAVERVKVDPKTLIKYSKVAQPQTQKEFEAELIDMVLSRDFDRKIKYDKAYDKSKNEKVKKAFANVFNMYPEYFSYANNIRTKISGNSKKMEIDISLESDSLNKTDKEIYSMIDAFEKRAQEVIWELEDKKLLNEIENEYEKARILYTWVIQNTKYEDTKNGEEFTGYGQMINGKAVCQGYTSSYNYLLRMAGIKDVKAVNGYTKDGVKHVWTQATLDGKKVYIDTTFGDPIPDRGDKVDYTFFDITEKELRKTHKW